MSLTWWGEHLSELPLIFLTVAITHLLMSFSQTLMHYRLGHRPLGGIFFRNHIHFHHAHYHEDHLVSPVYIKNDGDGNNTPFFMILVAFMVLATYFIFPLRVFITQIIAASASFGAHVYLDNRYHISGSPLLRFAWFRRKQQLHFVHHTHGDSNFEIAYSVLKTGTPYADLGADFYTRRESPDARQDYLMRQLQKLNPGCVITITPTEAA